MKLVRKVSKRIYDNLIKVELVNKIIQWLYNSLGDKKIFKKINPFLGFHGDDYLLSLLEFLITKCNFFIETGTKEGLTLKYVAKNYDFLNIFSCEPSNKSYSIASKELSDYKNCKIFNELSQKFIPKILKYEKIKKGIPFFFLDAHGYGFEWHLKFEIEQITKKLKKAIILIDDFKVPNNPQFKRLLIKY